MANEGKGKGNKKYGRNKRPVNSAMSAFVRGKMSAETYFAQSGYKPDKITDNVQKKD